MSPVVKRKGEKFTIPGKYLLFILTSVCVVLMVLTFSTDIFEIPLNTAVGYVVVPFQKGISKAGSWLSRRKDELAEVRTLLQENERLREQVDQLTQENIKLQQDKYELNTLRNLYELDGQYDSYIKVGARVIAKDTGNWYHSFTIDKGTNDGLAIDMNVIAEGGLVGRIVSVGPNWAQVMSIISDNSNVSGQVLSTTDKLIVTGDLEMMQKGLITFSQLLDTSENVAPGDKIVTSDISDKYLPGILIGYVNTVTLDSNKLTKSGTLTPAVDFEHMDEVLVIIDSKSALDEE